MFKSVVLGVLMSAAFSSTFARADSFDDTVARLELSNKSAVLKRYFPTTVGGEALRRATLLQAFRSSDEEEGKLLDANLVVARRVSAESLAAIESALKIMPANLVNERLFLIHMLTQLGGDTAIHQRVISREMARPLSRESVEQETAIALVGMHTLVRISGVQAAEQQVRVALNARVQNPDLQEVIVNDFEHIDNSRAQALRAQYHLRQPVVHPRPTPKPR